MKPPQRCPWGESHPLYVPYHDKEWGVPLHDDRGLFEFLVLEGAQAGLTWLTILKQARGVPQGVRRLRSAQGGALRRSQGRSACSPTKASSATA